MNLREGLTTSFRFKRSIFIVFFCVDAICILYREQNISLQSPRSIHSVLGIIKALYDTFPCCHLVSWI
jgi:hypothetical protein